MYKADQTTYYVEEFEFGLSANKNTVNHNRCQILSPWVRDLVVYGVVLSYWPGAAYVAWRRAGTTALCQSRQYHPVKD
jgi:hypothetical protein